MFAVENLLDCGSIAGSAYNIVQSQRIHNNEVSSAKKRHEESIALSVAQHEKDMKIAKQTYLMAAFTTLEQHFQVILIHSRNRAGYSEFKILIHSLSTAIKRRFDKQQQRE